MLVNSNSTDAAELLFEKMEFINENLEVSFMFLTVPSLVITVIFNMILLIKVLTMDRTMINQMMIIESFVNIFYAVFATFQQSPYFRGLNTNLYCLPHLVLCTTLVMANRLLPVAMALLRWEFMCQPNH